MQEQKPAPPISMAGHKAKLISNYAYIYVCMYVLGSGHKPGFNSALENLHKTLKISTTTSAVKVKKRKNAKEKLGKMKFK